MKRAWIAVSLLGCVVALAPSGCGPSCDETLTCGKSDGGEAGTDTGPDAPIGCDLAADPKDSPKCIDDSLGVFVSVMGSDTAPGTRAMPVKTIGHGLDVAKMKNFSRLYICEGAYPENLLVTDPRSLYGGFDCATWTYKDKLLTNVDPASGFALKATGAASMAIQDIVFKTGNATAPGDSSIAALFVGSSATIKRSTFSAGSGASGTKAADPMDPSPAMAAAGDGGKMNGPGNQTPNNCTNGSGSSMGGAGGSPGGADGINGQPFGMYTVNPPLADGAKGTTGGTCVTGIGHDGSYGPGGATGGVGAGKLGTLDAMGWHPEAGGAGDQGKVGQGGGGGASKDNQGGGGGGGPGGCGGDGGKGGAGGGASIALASSSSSITLQQTELLAKGAGNGAQGQTGQKAQGGGNGGSNFASSCQGGAGGHGGSGSGGGGGAGGVSIGLAYTGNSPTIDGSLVMDAMTHAGVTIATPGMPGAAGQGGVAFKTLAPASNGGANGTASVAGIAQAVKGF